MDSVLDAIAAIARYERDYRNFPFTLTVIKRLTDFDEEFIQNELKKLETAKIIRMDDREKYYLTPTGMNVLSGNKSPE